MGTEPNMGYEVSGIHNDEGRVAKADLTIDTLIERVTRHFRPETLVIGKSPEESQTLNSSLVPVILAAYVMMGIANAQYTG